MTYIVRSAEFPYVRDEKQGRTAVILQKVDKLEL